MRSGSGRVRVEQGAKRVRAYLGGEVVADSVRPRLVWEVPYYPAYYFPLDDVRTDLLVPTATVTHSPSRGDAQHFTVKAGGKEAVDAALRHVDSPIEELRGLIRLDWDAMDGWFEEDEEVYTHPRDPYTRVDILASSRRVRVEVDGVVLAESTNARVLYETGLPPRWYIPKTDVRMDLLTPAGTVTHCPYKGQAQYWSVRVGDRLVEDLAWSYRTTLPESQKIAGLVAFYNEEVDLFVDDRLQERPVTKFSRRPRKTGHERSEHMPDEHASRTRLERILGVRLAEDAVRQWPQSGELLEGRAHIGEVESHFVGLRLGVGRRHALGDTIVVEWSTDYGDGRVYRNVSIAELSDGKAIRVTDYWGEPFTPPAWREALAQRLDMPRDGVWPAAEALEDD